MDCQADPHISTIVMSAAINLHMQVSIPYSDFISFGYMPDVIWLDHKVDLYLFFLRNCHTNLYS